MARLGSTWFKAARLNLERPPSARARAGMSMSLEDALGVARIIEAAARSARTDRLGAVSA